MVLPVHGVLPQLVPLLGLDVGVELPHLRGLPPSQLLLGHGRLRVVPDGGAVVDVHLARDVAAVGVCGEGVFG